MFFLLLTNRSGRAARKLKKIKNTQKISSPILEVFFKYFLRNRFDPDVEFYDEKIVKNIYLTDIKAQKGFCVGGLLYRTGIRFLPKMSMFAIISSLGKNVRWYVTLIF